MDQRRGQGIFPVEKLFPIKSRSRGYNKNMEAKREFTDWRDFLAQVIKNSHERKRLAQEADIKEITLKRWVTRTSQPREDNLLQVGRAFSPELASVFLHLVEKEFPGLTQTEITYNRIVPEIPPELYAEVLQLYAKTPSSLARQNLQKLILEHLIKDLDPGKVGMVVTLVCCVPARPGQKIRALRQIGGIGTPPWEKDQEKKTLFVGAESVAGAAVTMYRTFAVDSRNDASLFSANWESHEQSAVAAPILRQAKITGALVASSAQAHHFTSEHKALLELYAHLVALLFQPAEFYDPNEIELGRMPAIALQAPYFADFDRRIAKKHAEIQANHGSINSQLAHQYVWQDIADELLNLSLEE
jgi:GAF domain-containing protein